MRNKKWSRDDVLAWEGCQRPEPDGELTPEEEIERKRERRRKYDREYKQRRRKQDPDFLARERANRNKWYWRNRDKCLAYHRKYQRNNRDLIRYRRKTKSYTDEQWAEIQEKRRQHVESKKEYYREWQARYREAHREKAKEYAREYYAEYRAKCCEKMRARNKDPRVKAVRQAYLLRIRAEKENQDFVAGEVQPKTVCDTTGNNASKE